MNTSQWRAVLFAAPGLLAFSTWAEATPSHAHWHYLIGARANAARMFATQLHHEATAPGVLYLEPARVNAEDLARLASEIIVRVDELERVSTDRENALIREHSQTIRTIAQDAATQATQLLNWIDHEVASGRTEIDGPAIALDSTNVTGVDSAQEQVVEIASADPTVAAGDPGATVRERIATQAATLYREFGAILKAHKDAEQVLGIAPPNPPPQ
jgi:hypothetical protein